MARYLILLALVLSGCGYRVAEEFVISPEFTPEQQEAIISAADEWCEVAGACVPVSVGEPANVVPDCEKEGTTAVDTFTHPEIRLCRDSERFRAVALHEMGHAFAPDRELEDSVGLHGVMSHPWDGSESLTTEDVAWVNYEPTN